MELSCHISCQHCQTFQLQTAFLLANEQRIHPVFKFTKCNASLKYISLSLPSNPLPSSPQPHSNWTLKCRHANQALIHLKLTGHPDYGGSLLLHMSHQYHLFRNTCLNIKELPGSISRSIVCQMCQQTEGKLSHTWDQEFNWLVTHSNTGRSKQTRLIYRYDFFHASWSGIYNKNLFPKNYKPKYHIMIMWKKVIADRKKVLQLVPNSKPVGKILRNFLPQK